MLLLNSAAIMKTISLTQLLSSCLDANRQGCEIIQNFYKKGAVDGTLKVGGDVKSVVTQADVDAQAKIVGGLRLTWNDNDNDNGGGNYLTIIGEEDETEAIPIMDGTPLRKDLLQQQQDSTEAGATTTTSSCSILDEQIPIHELALFVDPLDGTREFVEGRLHNVACLIGITRNNRPIAGLVGLPFPNGSTDINKDVIVHYAIADQKDSLSPSLKQAAEAKAAAAAAASQQSTEDSTTITIFTGDSKDPVLVNATARAISLAKNSASASTSTTTNANHVLVGGTAAKLVRVATEPNSIAILHFKTELWDTCALQAILECKGGKITDLFGSPLVHNPKRSFGNIFGVVASSGEPQVSKLHDELCSQMRADTQSVHKIFKKWMCSNDDNDVLPTTTTTTTTQAMDVARDLDGIPLSVSNIQEQLLKHFPTIKATLKSYSVPEDGAWRGMMSNGGRLNLNWSMEANEEGGGALSIPNELPKSVFYKRIVMADLAHARSKLTDAPHKLIRDVKSYQVETSFLTSQACQEGLCKEAGIRLNKVYGADLRPVTAEGTSAKEKLESRFSVLLEDFNKDDGWEQQWLLDEEAVEASLAEFANMHAYFWTGSQFWNKEDGKWGKELEKVVWSNGGYMQPALQGYDQLQLVAKGWEKRYPTFQDDLAKIDLLNGVDLSSLGAKLQTIAHDVGAESHPFYDDDDDFTKSSEFQKYRTLIHGDPKQANIFFRRDKESNKLHVGLIDFQWCGFGLAATDIAHHIYAAVHPSCVSVDGKKEQQLLDHYYSCLCSKLVEYGVAKTTQEVEETIFPRSVLKEQYDTAVLDVSRMVFAYAWRRWKAESEPTPESLNRNAYNKSLQSALWLITRCHFTLEKRLSKKN